MTADMGGMVRIWDTHGDDMYTKSELKVLNNRIHDIAWDHKSERLIAVGKGNSSYGSAFRIDGGSSGEVHSLSQDDVHANVTGHSPLNGYVTLNAVAISPNQPSRAVTVGDDSQMGFYLGPRYQWKSKQHKHTGFVSDVTFSPDGTRIVSVGEDRKINLFSGTDASHICTLGQQGHSGSILSVGWKASGESIVTSSADRTVKLWDVESQTVVKYHHLPSVQ